jgi:hypothetical protein
LYNGPVEGSQIPGAHVEEDKAAGPPIKGIKLMFHGKDLAGWEGKQR